MQDSLFFDWYSASIPCSPNTVSSVFSATYPHCVWEITKPKNGYTHADALVDQHGETILTMFYGGANQGLNTFAFASGIHAASFAINVRSAFPDHELVRADVAVDYDEGGAWHSLYGHSVSVSAAVSVMNRYIGRAGAEVSVEEKQGRSLYLGSRSSPSMIRVYEKGKKDDRSRPDWVRAEFEFKPKGSDARRFYAKASILEIISSTKLGRRFFSTLGAAVTASPCAPGTVRVKTSHQQTMEHLIKQYGKVLLKELEIRGGSYEELGKALIHGAA